MAFKQSSIAGPKPVAVQVSTVFYADDADVVIRAARTLDFRVHKCILLLILPIFKDVFIVPQPWHFIRDSITQGTTDVYSPDPGVPTAPTSW